MIDGASGCGLCPWNSSRKVRAYALMSVMTINPVSVGLNGVQVNCIDSETSESAATTIQFVQPDTRGKI